MGKNFRTARWLALLIPAGLLAGAWGSQLIGHLFPCEMCHWQRWPHYVVLPIALLAFLPGMPQRLLVGLAALAIATSGAIGVLHAGTEYHWWQGITTFTSTIGAGGGNNLLEAIMKAPPIRCDVAQCTLFGISLAGFNAIISLGGALVIAVLLVQSRRGRR